MSEANVFILLNLGCEMIYVIDQRLTAQSVAFSKSIQVLQDITNALLERKFIERLIAGSKQKILITPEHTRIILNDMACCSLMRLDENSMNKLWDLITMIYKWQIFESKTPQHILDISFRHLDGIGKLHPNPKKLKLIDFTKNIILDLWNSYSETEQFMIFETLQNWFDIFHVKLSILIRLGFQGSDGEFFKQVHLDHMDLIGENIYSKNAENTNQTVAENSTNYVVKNHKFDHLIDQLNLTTISEQNHQTSKRPSSILFTDFKVQIKDKNPNEIINNSIEDNSNHEFVQLNNSRITAAATNSSWETLITNKNQNTTQNTNENLNSLLNLKLN